MERGNCLGWLLFPGLGLWASSRLNDAHPTLGAVAFLAAVVILLGGVVSTLVGVPLVALASWLGDDDGRTGEGAGLVVGVVFGLLDTAATLAVVGLLAYSFFG